MFLSPELVRPMGVVGDAEVAMTADISAQCGRCDSHSILGDELVAVANEGCPVERLGEDVGDVVVSVSLDELDGTLEHLVADEVVLGLDVLGAFVMDRVLGELDARRARRRQWWRPDDAKESANGAPQHMQEEAAESSTHTLAAHWAASVR